MREINRDDYRSRIRYEQQNWHRRNDHGYEWRRWGDHDVCHHYDQRGFHWWGFYVGDIYFWTRYWNDNYWWYDPYWHRWCYMHDSRWWWHDPAAPSIIYVYTDNGYYRYDGSNGGVVMRPDPTPPAEAPPTDPAEPPSNIPQPTVYTSTDGSRLVTVSADGKQTAYLSDTADPPAFEPVWLGDGVTEVRFKLDEQGALSEILTIKADGSFNTYDHNGYMINAPTLQPQVFTSPDKTRIVTISADAAGLATLTDTADPPTLAPVTLASGVVSVDFTLDDEGRLVQITLLLRDGALSAYNRNGEALAGAAPAEPLPPPGDTAPDSSSGLRQSLMKSAAFSALKETLGW